MVRSLQCNVILAGTLLLVGTMAGKPAMADVKDGVDAWSLGDYAAALREWRAAAEKGDADALFNLAQAYKLGRGVNQDLAKAEELFGKAAAQGHMQASDNYGLLLFQRGEHARALPYIRAAADRGDPRAQYVLGLVYFNGDGVPIDWVMAYALLSLSHQAGVQQAAAALTEMDQYVPLEQRQKSVMLASQLEAQTKANRARQLAAADLSMNAPLKDPTPPQTAPLPDSSADYTRSKLNTAVAEPFALSLTSPGVAPAPAAQPVTRIASAKPAKPTPAPATPAPAASGKWRIQLGAFGVPGNAEGLWSRVKNRPELAGHAPLFVKTGKLTLLQAGGFASRGEAQAACSRLTAGGFTCMPAGN